MKQTAMMVAEVIPDPIEVRAEREARMLESMDNRTPLEKLFDFMAAARLAVYRPDSPPAMRGDIICLCCGRLYRPDDVLNGENVFLCGTCILTRIESQE